MGKEIFYTTSELADIAGVLMFKYLDFTLEEIGQMLEYENIQESLGKQLELIELKITHLSQIKKQLKICNHYQLTDMWYRDGLIESVVLH